MPLFLTLSVVGSVVVLIRRFYLFSFVCVDYISSEIRGKIRYM